MKMSHFKEKLMNWKQLKKFKKKRKKKVENYKLLAAPKISDEEANKALDDLLLKQRIGLFFGDPKGQEKPISYVLTKNGIYEVRKNKIGMLAIKINKCTNFPDYTVKEGITLNVPKIPIQLLNQIVGFFKEIDKTHKAEAYVQILFNPKKKEYTVSVPEQNVSGAHVDYKHDNNVYKDSILVMDIHSHNTMGAFFSGTDDKDEQRDQLYGVIGNIEKQEPDMKFRMCCGGKHHDLDMEQLFDIPGKTYDFPEEWMGQIKKKPVNPLKTTKTYYPGTGWQGGLFGDDGDDVDELYSGYRRAMENDRYDPLDRVINRCRKPIHSMTEKEYDSSELIGMNDTPEGFYDPNDFDFEEDEEFNDIDSHLTLADLHDTLVDLPKKHWPKIIGRLMHEDYALVNRAVNEYNHFRKKNGA